MLTVQQYSLQVSVLSIIPCLSVIDHTCVGFAFRDLTFAHFHDFEDMFLI